MRELACLLVREKEREYNEYRGVSKEHDDELHIILLHSLHTTIRLYLSQA